MQLYSRHECYVQGIATSNNPAVQYLRQHKLARVGLYAAAILLAGSLILTAFRVVRKYNTPQNKRKRNVSKNKVCHRRYT